MNRSDRRWFHKEFTKVLNKSGGVCGICKVSLQYNCQTYGGIAVNNRIVLTSDCCVSKLECVMCSGVYVNRNIDAVFNCLPDRKRAGSMPVAEVMAVTSSLQSSVSAIDEISDELMERGGVPFAPNSVELRDTPWKTADALWFQKHPNRSHRLRPIFSGEIASLPRALQFASVPENHRLEILVRQVAAGQRLRTAFFRNAEAIIPDEEAVIHALFDIVSNHECNGEAVGSMRLGELIALYGNSAATMN